MDLEDNSQDSLPAEERFLRISDDVRIKTISKNFVKTLRVHRLGDIFQQSSYPPGCSQADCHRIMTEKAQAFGQMLFQVVDLSHNCLWSTILFNPPVIESIFEFLDMSRVSAGIEPLIKDPAMFPILLHIDNSIFQFIFRFFLTRENDRDFLSQEFHDEVLLKHFTYFRRFVNVVQHFTNPGKVFIDLVSGFMYRQEVWFQKNFETFKNELIDRLARFPVMCFEDVIFALRSVVDDLGVIERFSSMMTGKKELILNEGFVDRLLEFYGKFMTYYKNYVEPTNPTPFNEAMQPLIEKLQSCLITLFHRYFENTIISDLELALPKSNADLYNALEMFDRTLHRILTEHQQFIIDFFCCFSFQSVFKLFYGDELKRIVKSEISLSNYEGALQEARALFEPSHMWWRLPSPDEFIIPLASPEPDVVFIEEISSSSQKTSPSSQPSTPPLKHLQSSPQIAAMETSIKEVIGDPALGDGYIYLCLEYYSFDQEKVINAIFENALPGQLKNLDRNLTKVQANEIKGNEIAKSHQLTDAYIGKKNKVASILKNDNDKENLKAKTLGLSDKIVKEEEEKEEEAKRLLERGADIEEMKNDIAYLGVNLYNDEYDDTYENEDLGADAFDKDDENKPAAGYTMSGPQSAINPTTKANNNKPSYQHNNSETRSYNPNRSTRNYSEPRSNDQNRQNQTDSEPPLDNSNRQNPNNSEGRPYNANRQNQNNSQPRFNNPNRQNRNTFGNRNKRPGDGNYGNPSNPSKRK